MIGKDKQKTVYSASEYEDNYNVFVIEFFGGVAKNISEHIQLQALGGYSRSSYKPLDGVDGAESDVCQGLVIKVGFLVILDTGLF